MGGKASRELGVVSRESNTREVSVDLEMCGCLIPDTEGWMKVVINKSALCSGG